MSKSLYVTRDSWYVYIDLLADGCIRISRQYDDRVNFYFDSPDGFTEHMTSVRGDEARANIQSIEDWAAAHRHYGAQGMAESIIMCKAKKLVSQPVGEWDLVVAVVAWIVVTGVLPRLLIYAIGCLTSEK